MTARTESMPQDQRARIAIDLGAESCRVSLLRWQSNAAVIELVHRAPNGPVHRHGALCWPLDAILEALEAGLRKAASIAVEGVASIGVDGWAVDYVRLGPGGLPLGQPFCYRDERTVAAKEAADRIVSPEWMFRHTGAQPLRINTVYQLLADRARAEIADAPWMNLPEYVLHWLGGRRVAEYTNATHTALVDLADGQWSQQVVEQLQLSREALPPIVPTGSVIGKLRGELAGLAPFSDTDLIAPACHDTASAIAAIPARLRRAAYICSGTWSLVGTRVAEPVTTLDAMRAGFTNQGAAGEGFLFHTNVNGMWILKQCLESWRKQGRSCALNELIAAAAERSDFPGIVAVDAPSLLLDDNMPERLNAELRSAGLHVIEDRPGNEPVFARMIFESLAARYAAVLQDLERILGTELECIHLLGGGAQNQLLTRLTAERTGLPVQVGNPESSTIGNFAIQLAAGENAPGSIPGQEICRWAKQIIQH